MDLERLRLGFIDSFQMSATNVGLIATENLTFWLPDYWENVAFITPEKTNLGQLPANSTLSLPVEIVHINRYEIPPDRAELRDPLNPNNVIFLPLIEDERWDTGLDLISINAANPAKQWYYKLDINGTIQFVYSYSDRTRYDFIYNGVETNGTMIPTDIIITNNTSLVMETRNLFVDVPPPIFELGNERRLDGLVEGCANIFICVACEAAWSRVTGGLAGAISKGLKNVKKGKKTLEKEEILRNPTTAQKIKNAYSQLCSQVDKLKEFLEHEWGPVSIELIETPEFLNWLCPDLETIQDLILDPESDIAKIVDGILDPCQYICQRETVGGGCTEYECGGVIIELCMPTLTFPDPGDCFEFEPITPSPPCPRCGVDWGGAGEVVGGGGWSMGNPFALSGVGEGCKKIGQSAQRKLFGCTECSSEELKAVFREVDNRQDAFQEAEARLLACTTISQLGVKSLFPCIFRSTLELLDVAPRLSGVISCQLSREVCYDSSDLVDSPGLINLFTQAKRFEAVINLISLPHSGFLRMDPLAPSARNKNFNYTQAITFGGALVDALADSGEAGEFITNVELDSLIDLEVTVLSEWDIIQFAATWNQSLVFWNEGIFSASDLPTNYSDPFFDLKEATAQMTEFLSARDDVLREFYTGFSDAWLTAVEGQQLEESQKLAGVCASVRVQIEQEMTLTRIGFEAHLDITNDGDSNLENVTGEQHDNRVLYAVSLASNHSLRILTILQ